MLLHDPPRHRAPDEPIRAIVPSRPPEGMAVGRALAVAAVALALAALLDAEALQGTARAQPFGWRRDVATAAVDPLVDLSRGLHLTAPRHWLEDALDRPSTRPLEPVPTTVTTAPPAGSTTSTPPSSTTTTTTPPARRIPTADVPLRLLIAGDSMTESAGPALLDAALATGVVAGDHELRYSSGLTRPDYFDWPATLAGLLARDDPEAVVIFVGANDAQGIQTPDGPAAFGTPAWIGEYRTRVAAVMDLLGGDDRTIYWIGEPVMRSGTFDERMRLVTGIYQEEAASHPAVRFIDTRALFAADDGGYSAYLPDDEGRPVLVRRDDGIHLTAAGADRLAEVVLGTIAADWEIGGAP